ncbi:class I SAM-dependent methyltransferase [Ancylobacter sp. WKF20]|uniref:class I SAM-dependent methyltransferase n=1 Tax=Ancylobacter sp. WKF20 TaxID=3039801 RepID=UPI0024343E13|nr:class I SAM-dependent methyltransferase [Ancylobacter sp. WKF20]WGD29781.1 class I SAM-dependent methyltransferase [Ancylobacter sp. WKF20]
MSEISTSGLSRLEKTLFRLEAQHACLGYAFDAIATLPGPVVEFGLGLGRTFDHLRRHLPDREIYVFDRVNKAYSDCQPDPAHLILGEIEETLPPLALRLAGRVVLANADLGSFDRESNRAVAAMSARLLPPLIAPGGFIMSDLPLELPGFETVPLPAGAREGRYYLYRRPVSS